MWGDIFEPLSDLQGFSLLLLTVILLPWPRFSFGHLTANAHAAGLRYRVSTLRFETT